MLTALAKMLVTDFESALGTTVPTMGFALSTEGGLMITHRLVSSSSYVTSVDGLPFLGSPS